MRIVNLVVSIERAIPDGNLPVAFAFAVAKFASSESVSLSLSSAAAFETVSSFAFFFGKWPSAEKRYLVNDLLSK